MFNDRLASIMLEERSKANVKMCGKPIGRSQNSQEVE
jgi:hypothetical protein